MKIYTRAGDGGESALPGVGRVGKDDAAFELLGTLDELNSALGVAAAQEVLLDPSLAALQSMLLDIGAEIASPKLAARLEGAVQGLEASIDAMEEALPPLANFILPGGSQQGAALHLARAVCRRTERQLVRYSRIQPVRPEILAVLNRLGDWLFVAAREVNRRSGATEDVWRRG